MVSAKTKLLVIISGLRAAGAELMLFRLLKNIDRRFFQIKVISLTSKDKVGELLQAENIEVDSLNIGGLFSLIFRFPALVFKIRKFNPDVIQTWMYHADLLGGVAAKIARVGNVIWSIRNSHLDIGTAKLGTLIVAKICAIFSSWLPKLIISCSEVSRESHVSFGYSSNKIVVIPNGIELDRFIPDAAARLAIRSELGVLGNTRIVGLIGRYHVIKNHACFVKAAFLICKTNPNVYFLLAGSDVDSNNSDLISMIESANLLSRFYLLGERSDVHKVISSLDILVSASSGEAFPNVIGEAMACGIPCVATDVGDSALIIGDTGKIVPVNDPVALADSVLDLLNLPPDEKMLLGLKARDRINHHFDIKSVSLKYQNVYEKYRFNPI